jgi:hypothetical protein
MSLSVDERPVARKVSRPAFLHVTPDAVGNRGEAVADLARSLGQEVGPEERIVLEVLTPIRADGRCAGLGAGVIAGRRNIKSWGMEMCAIDDAFVEKVGRVVWSAHLYDTALENFLHMRGLVENYDWLRKRVHKVRNGRGDEGFELLGGRRIDFMARQGGKTGRGHDVDRLYFDEWLFGTASMQGASVPMMSAARDPFMRYGSSPGLLLSSELRRLRAAGRSGKSRAISYAEWTSERVVDGNVIRPKCAADDCSHQFGMVRGCVLDDEDLWVVANPALDRRISREFVRNEREILSPLEFSRERLGWWEDPPEGDVDEGLANWPKCQNPAAAPTGTLTLAVDASLNMASGAIVAASWDGSRAVVEVIDHRPGTAWIASLDSEGKKVGRLAELIAKHKPASWGYVAGSPAAALENLPDGGTELKAAETTAACATFARAVSDGLVAHLDDPILNDAVGVARRKFSGDGWRWSRRDSDGDISALYAATVARHLLTTQDAPYDPMGNLG